MPNVKVIDATKLSQEQLAKVLSSPGEAICAWCLGARTRRVLNVLAYVAGVGYVMFTVPIPDGQR
jgi:hypothetical protein